uniref:uncharacterized protein LOC109965805 isoform X2 n=1 Tax=Monopterus albus TaxID=43700 RepID=UPI0009B43AF5|nr:uncharacterized protein LOC109965805 isoform X2 [Monopterus albus]
MIPSKHLKTSGQMPWGRFITTYSCDFRPFTECHLQANQLKPRDEAKAAAAHINPPQAKQEVSPVFNQYFYKTTNSVYGSTTCPQPASCYPLPASLSPGILAPCISAPTESRTQEVRMVKETGHLLGGGEECQRSCVCVGNEVLKQMEAKDEPQQKTDVLYEKGVIVLSSHNGPACCEDFLSSLCREAGLSHLPNFPVAPSPVIINKDAEYWDNLRGSRPAGLANGSFLQPTSRQCICCAWDTEHPCSCCFGMPTFPPPIPWGSAVALANVPPTVYHPASSRKQLLTEYQTSYTTEWPQSRNRLSDFHHHHPRCHWNPHSSL